MRYDDDMVRERIQKLIHLEGVSQKGFAERIGYNASNLSQSLLGKRPMPQIVIKKIIECYPNVRKEWLLFGDGGMYVDDSDVYNKIVAETKPRMPMNVTGSIADYMSGTKRYMCDERPVIKQFPDYDCTIVLKNDSMEPRYERGDEIAIKKVLMADYGRNGVMDTKSIEWGHDYVIDCCSAGPKFKKLYEDGNYFVLRSYNREKYPDFKIPKSEVCSIYRVVGMLRV